MTERLHISGLEPGRLVASERSGARRRQRNGSDPIRAPYRELGLGTVVGEPTAGWIISTGSRGLVDGTSVRMPGTFIRDNRGQNMELNPRPVDVEVERATGEWYEGRDSQLERAVEVLLGEIDGGE